MLRSGVVSAVIVVLTWSTPADAQPTCPRTLVFKTVRPSSQPSVVPGAGPSRLDAELTPERFHQLYGRVFAGGGSTTTSGRLDYAVTGAGEPGGPDMKYCLGVGLGYLGTDNVALSTSGHLHLIPWHGEQVALHGACAGGRESFRADLEAWLASNGGVRRLLAGYEQIPVKASGRLEAKCVVPGETVPFHLSQLESGVDPLRSSMARPRLVVEPEDGTVDNGDPGPSGKQKVFAVSRTTSDQGFTLNYRAPPTRTRAVDVLHVFNSCDVVDEDLKPMNQTTRAEEIATFEIPICDSYRLEYRYDVKITAEGSNMDYQVRGEVPFRITDRSGTLYYGLAGRPDEVLKVEGEATLGATMKGRQAGCSIDAHKQFTVKLTGELRFSTMIRQARRFFLKVQEEHRTPLTMTLRCPEAPAMTVSRRLPAPTIEYREVELPDEEGAQVSGPFQGQGGTGTYTLILHQSSAQ